MQMSILRHTPSWVFILFALLICIGIAQSFTRRRTLYGAVLLPVAMIMLSGYGVISVFSFRAEIAAAWICGIAAALTLCETLCIWKNISWSASDKRLIVPGSWLPMALIIGIFTAKFYVGAALAMDRGLALDIVFAASVSCAYGFLSGIFFARGLIVWRIVRLHIHAQ